MTDPADETPARKALRLKKAALEARSGPPRGKLDPRQSAGLPTGKSKPWMKKH